MKLDMFFFWMTTLLICAFFWIAIFCEIARAEDIDFDCLVSAVITVESGGNPNAVSPSGAIGLMQVTPIVVKVFRQVNNYTGEINLFTAYVNEHIGTWYLHRLHDHYGCDTVEQIAAAYNGGITRLRKNGYDIAKMPKETREYVRKVMKEYTR